MAYKKVDLFDRKQPWIPSKEKVSGNEVLEGFWSKNVMASADNALAQGARSVFDLNVQGAMDFLCTSSLSPSGTFPGDKWWGIGGGLSGTWDQIMPEPDVVRDVGYGNFTITPGNWLRCRILCMDSGETQGAGETTEQGVENQSLWWPSGTYGEVILSCTFMNSSSALGNNTYDVVKKIVLPNSQHPSGTLDPNNAWKNMRTVMVPEIMVPAFKTNAAIAVNFSEMTNCEIKVQEKGSPRIIHLNVTEFPFSHVQSSTTASADVSAHAYVAGGQIPPQVITDYPQTDELDGVVDEGRFGSLKTLDVLNNQIERLGPAVLNWSSWNHSGSAPNTTQMAIAITGSSFVSVPDLLYTEWDLDGNGWIFPSANAQQHEVNKPLRGKRAVMPVNIRVRASVNGTLRVRVQTCFHSFYEWTITGANGAQLWHQDTAYLEGSLADDDMEHNCQIFMKADNGSAAVTAMQVIFGEYLPRGL